MKEMILEGRSLGYTRDISQAGEGIVALESAEAELNGRVTFIPGLIPGDLIEIEEVYTKGKKVHVDRYRLVESSPYRQEAFCPHFGECGGCQLQHMTYEATLAWKTKRVKDLLARMAKIDEADDLVAPCQGLAEPFAYRSIVQLRPDRQGKLGFYKKNSKHIIALEACPLQTEAFHFIRQTINSLLDDIQASEVVKLKEVEIRQNNESSRFMVLLQYREEIIEEDWETFFDELIIRLEAEFGESSHSLWLEDPEYLLPLYGEEKLYVEEKIDDDLELKFHFSVKSFQQTNIKQNRVLYKTVADLAKKALTSCDGPRILELYCGSGSLSLCLAKAIPEASILGAEIVEEAVLDARSNAALNFISEEQARFVKADATDFFSKEMNLAGDRGEAEDRSFDLLLVDPPRQGLDKELCEAILRSGIDHLLYVSCDPASLARDTGILKEKYTVQEVRPIDMFPWTTHVETVALLSKLDVDKHIEVEIEMDELDLTTSKSCKIV